MVEKAKLLLEEIRQKGRIFYRPQQANELAWLLSHKLIRSRLTTDNRTVYYI